MYMANVRILRWGPNANLYSTDLRWGFTLGVTQILVFTLEVTQIFRFLDTNMLVSKRKFSHWGADPTASQFKCDFYYGRSGIFLGLPDAGLAP